MKRLLLALSVLAVLLSTFPIVNLAFATEVKEEISTDNTENIQEFDESKFGDIDNNGKLTAADARILLRCSVGLEEITEPVRLYGDYTRDKKITAEDARISLRISVGLEKIGCIFHGHKLSKHTINATCTQKGYTTNKCINCSYTDGTEVDLINPTGHKLCTRTTKANCTENGITTVYCEICNHKESETVTEKAHGHHYSYWESNGTVKSKACKSCGSKITSNKGKTVYLTFDDGPGPYTEKLLGYLNEYNVKATFFVTNQMPRYRYLIKMIADNGHSIGVHTLTHQWNIYSSKERYLNDFNAIHKIIQDDTGIDTKIFRFPGGTNNTVSRSYCRGIMSTMSKHMLLAGYSYYDWNVDCCDTLGYSSSQIANTTISQIRNKNFSIVLMHDIKNTTVEAVKTIIKFGLDNGYEFLPIDESTPIIRFSPVN